MLPSGNIMRAYRIRYASVLRNMCFLDKVQCIHYSLFEFQLCEYYVCSLFTFIRHFRYFHYVYTWQTCLQALVYSTENSVLRFLYVNIYKNHIFTKHTSNFLNTFFVSNNKLPWLLCVNTIRSILRGLLWRVFENR